MPFVSFYRKAMTSATLTSKHQITIPSPVRRQLGLQRGDRVVFTPDNKGNFHLSRSAGGHSDGFARKFLSSGTHAPAADKATASRQATAAAYRRRNG